MWAGENYADASSGKQRQKEARLLLMLSTKCSQVAGQLDMRMPATCCGQSRHKSGVVNDTGAVLRGGHVKRAHRIQDCGSNGGAG